jgi:uncharacterized protein (TIGR02453 family)
MQIEKSTLTFLKELRDNNNKPWFTENKKRYEAAKENVTNFMKALEIEMNKKDQIEKAKLFRIYRDVRFSKDKTPYKDHMDIGLDRLKPHLRGGYYVRISPGQSLLGAGFWNPETSDLELIRRNIEFDGKNFKKAINDKKLKSHWGEIGGEQLKTAPKGFDKEHEHIDLIRHKQFIFHKDITDKEVLSKEYLSICTSAFQSLKPWYDYMSDILSHNLNGEPLY